MRISLLIIFGVLICSFSASGQFGVKKRLKKIQYQEIKFEDLIKRYFEKETTPLNTLEGIYSVSCVITKKGRNFFGIESERPVQRKDNYARVAILKDRQGSSSDYIEVSLSFREANRYPIMGEFNILSEGRGLIYNHVEPNGSIMSFSMKSDSDIMDGEYSIMDGNKTITYKLSYLRIYPKSSAISVRSY